MAPEHKRLRRYGTMTIQEIKELPVPLLAADKAQLYHHPKWQFDRTMQVLAEVGRMLKLFRTHDTMRVLSGLCSRLR